jgi:hypothetical protein
LTRWARPAQVTITSTRATKLSELAHGTRSSRPRRTGFAAFSRTIRIPPAFAA